MKERDALVRLADLVQHFKVCAPTIRAHFRPAVVIPGGCKGGAQYSLVKVAEIMSADSPIKLEARHVKDLLPRIEANELLARLGTPRAKSGSPWNYWRVHGTGPATFRLGNDHAFYSRHDIAAWSAELRRLDTTGQYKLPRDYVPQLDRPARQRITLAAMQAKMVAKMAAA